MKIIFIDVDDTLRTHKNMFFSQRVSGDLDVYSVALLQRACEFTGAKIVCISSLFNAAVKPHKAEFVELMTEAGFDIDTHLHDDWSPRESDQEARGAIVDRWLARHPDVTHAATLDDERVLRDGAPHPSWVHVEEHKGLQADHMYRVMELLDADPGAFFQYCRQRPMRFSGLALPLRP